MSDTPAPTPQTKETCDWYVFRGDERIGGPLVESEARSQAATLKASLVESNRAMSDSICVRRNLLG